MAEDWKERAMWRFLPAAFLFVAAIVVLVAGASGDMQSWAASSDLWEWSMQDAPTALRDSLAGVLARLAPAPAVRQAPPSVPAAQAPAPAPAPPDALRNQLAMLESQVAQQKQEIASLSAAGDKARQDLDALRQQRETQAAPKTLPVDPVRARPVMAVVPRPAPARPQPRPASAPPQPAASAWIAVPTQESVPPRERLIAARQALLSGRNEEAKSLMETAQLQFVFAPVDPDAAAGDSINMPATWIGRALKSLQLGDASGALHDLDLAMNSS